ncbi:MAG: transketolase C-terminal domain-containing protein, partial [Oscillospiraceae bacterium]
VGPVYLRFGRLAVPVINDENYKFEIGKGVTLRQGSDISIIATGLMVAKALQAAEVLKSEGISARVINIHTIKPIDKDIILKAARETKMLVTCEEHSVIGGLFSAVCEVTAQEAPCKIVPVAVMDTFGKSGPAQELLDVFKLSTQGILDKIKANYK